MIENDTTTSDTPSQYESKNRKYSSNSERQIGDLDKSKHRHSSKSKRKKLATYLNTKISNLKQSAFFNLFVIFIISILSNCIYYNFILDSNQFPVSYRVRKIGYDTNERTKPSLKSLITWSSSSYYLEQSNDLKFDIKSFDHVFFGSIDDKYSNKDQQVHVQPSTDFKFDDDLFEEKNHQNIKEVEKKRYESNMAVSLAKTMQKNGKLEKAGKIYRYALVLDPENIDALTSYGEYLELHKKDVLKAEHYYSKVVNIEPENNQANLNLKRATPLVAKKDRQILDNLDNLLKRFYDIPSTSSALKRAKREAYFMHIYHSNAIEGNTLNLQQTRHIVENRMAVNGKSLHEHNEVLGLDLAMRFLNETLLYRPLGHFQIKDIIDIHRRVLGFCDPIESGKFRKHQVYVGHFTPPSPDHVEHLMDEFIEWLNSNELLTEAHPIQIAAMAHYKFVYIHPFYDGNGRTARLIMNLLLMKFGYPPIIIKKEDRLEYYEYLEMANQGDIKPFIRFIARCTQRTLMEYIRLCNNSYSLSVDQNDKMFRGDLILNEQEKGQDLNDEESF